MHWILLALSFIASLAHASHTTNNSQQTDRKIFKARRTAHVLKSAQQNSQLPRATSRESQKSLCSSHNCLQTLIKFPKEIQALILGYLEDWRVITQINCKFEPGNVTPAISSNGTYLANIIENKIEIWDVLNKNKITTLVHPRNREKQQEMPFDAVFTPDSQQLITTSDFDRTILWDIGSGTCISQVFNDPSVNSAKDPFPDEMEHGHIILSPNCKYIAILNGQNSDYLHIFKVPFTTGDALLYEQETSVFYATAAFSGNGKYLALLGNLARKSDATTPKELSIAKIAHQLDSVIEHESEQITIVDADTDQTLQVLAHDKPISSLALSYDGLYLAIASYNSQPGLENWDGIEIFKQQEIELQQACTCKLNSDKNLLPISQKILPKDIQKLIVSYLSEYNSVIKLPYTKPISSPKSDKSVEAVIDDSHIGPITISPDNKFLAFINKYGNAKLTLIDINSQKQIYCMPAAEWSKELRYSADGDFIFSQSHGTDTSYIFHAHTGRRLICVPDNLASLSHDGKYLISRANPVNSTEILINQATELKQALIKAKRLAYLKTVLKTGVKRLVQEEKAKKTKQVITIR